MQSSKRDMKHVLAKTPSGSSFPTSVAPPLNRQLSTVLPTSFSATGSQSLWGELDSSEQPPAPTQPIRPLWSEGWKAKAVTCRAPRLYLPKQNALTEPADA